jgi:hypothetical protein
VESLDGVDVTPEKSEKLNDVSNRHKAVVRPTG